MVLLLGISVPVTSIRGLAGGVVYWDWNWCSAAITPSVPICGLFTLLLGFAGDVTCRGGRIATGVGMVLLCSCVRGFLAMESRGCQWRAVVREKT